MEMMMGSSNVSTWTEMGGHSIKKGFSSPFYFVVIIYIQPQNCILSMLHMI